ncbi:MAG: hypothetical protein AB2693_31155 [Candidatus Thiodiazotropha sp.]
MRERQKANKELQRVKVVVCDKQKNLNKSIKNLQILVKVSILLIFVVLCCLDYKKVQHAV